MNKVLRVKFLDHVVTTGGISSPMECTVYGEVVGEDKEAYYIASWVAYGSQENNDTYTILKSTIKEIKKLK